MGTVFSGSSIGTATADGLGSRGGNGETAIGPMLPRPQYGSSPTTVGLYPLQDGQEIAGALEERSIPPRTNLTAIAVTSWRHAFMLRSNP